MFKKLSIIVVRVGKNGEIRNSAPCMDCTTILKRLQIKKIVCSNEDGLLSGYKVKEYQSDHITTSRKLAENHK